MGVTVADEAREASQPPQLVELVRGSLEDGSSMRGFVVEVGAEWLLLHLLSDRLDLDGYTAVRMGDVTARHVDFPEKSFYLKALGLKGIHPVRPKAIALSDVRDLMRSVEARYPLVVIHRERVVPGECEIGRLKLASGETYAIRYISPTASWEDDFRTYRYADVTRLQFDGEYENTLALVAGGAA